MMLLVRGHHVVDQRALARQEDDTDLQAFTMEEIALFEEFVRVGTLGLVDESEFSRLAEVADTEEAYLL